MFHVGEDWLKNATIGVSTDTQTDRHTITFDYLPHAMIYNNETDKNGGFSRKWGLYIKFYFQNPSKRHIILAWDRVFWRSVRKDQFGCLGWWARGRTPKNKTNILGIIFHPEKNPGRIGTKLCTGRYSG